MIKYGESFTIGESLKGGTSDIKNRPINFPHIYFSDSPACKDMKKWHVASIQRFFHHKNIKNPT